MPVEESFDHSTFDYWFRLGHICTYLRTELWMEADQQTEEFVDRYLKKSTTDAIILVGDFNTPPILKPGEPYDVIQQFMNNACKEFTWIKFHLFKECLGPKFAMYGNLRNSFSYMYGSYNSGLHIFQKYSFWLNYICKLV